MPEDTKFEFIGAIQLGCDLWLGPAVHVKASRKDQGILIATDADTGRVFVESHDGTPLRVVIDLEAKPAEAAPTEPAPAEPAGE